MYMYTYMCSDVHVQCTCTCTCTGTCARAHLLGVKGIFIHQCNIRSTLFRKEYSFSTKVRVYTRRPHTCTHYQHSRVQSCLLSPLYMYIEFRIYSCSVCNFLENIVPTFYTRVFDCLFVLHIFDS